MDLKIIYFSKTAELGPASRYRIFQFEKYFAGRGVDITIVPAFSDSYLRVEKRSNRWRRYLEKGFLGMMAFVKRVLSFHQIFGAHVVAVEREFFPCFPPIFELMMKVIKGGYILEFDDAIFLSRWRRSKYPATVKMASKVIVGNTFLEEYAGRYNDNTAVIPTCVDTDRYELKKGYEIGGTPRVGWIGLPYNFDHLKLVEEPLKKLFEERGGELCVVSARAPFLGFPVKFVEWKLEEEAELIRSFDIGIMPLADTPFSRGKCGLKILQYMASGIPVVASPVGVNNEIIVDGVNGFVARNSDEWYEKVKVLLGDEKLRERVGRKGRETVEDKFSVHRWGERLVSLYTETSK